MEPIRTAAAALALLATGCASLGWGRPPRSGAAWRELSTEHFVLRTDLPAGEAGQLVQDLETMRRAVLAALFCEAREPPGRVEVIAFREGVEYADFAPENAAAYYLRAAGGPARMVMRGGLGDWQRVVLAHELAHHVLSGLAGRQPRWLAEGLAVWMEGLARQPLRAHMVLGEAHEGRFPTPRTRRIPLRELFAWDEAPVEGDWLDYYTSALVLVRHLYDRHADGLRDLIDRLGRGEPPAAAFAAALPQFDPARPGGLEALEAEVSARLASHLPFPGVDVDVAVGAPWVDQAMEPAEVAALRLTLWGQGPLKSKGALRAEVREALAHDPAHPVALQVRSELDRTDPLPAARRAAAAHPDDPRAWTFLGFSVGGPGPEREEAFRRAAELAPQNAAVLWNLAHELLEKGRSGEALPLARRAAQLAPWSPPVVQGYASVLADLGQCAAALAAQERAMGLVSERFAEPERRALRQRLEELVRRCPLPGAEREGGQGSRTSSP